MGCACDKNVQFLSAEKPFNSELTVSYVHFTGNKQLMLQPCFSPKKTTTTKKDKRSQSGAKRILVRGQLGFPK